MRMAWLSGLLLALANAATAQESPIPVDQEPHHKVVLKNDFVIVMHVTLQPDERTLYHTHSHNRSRLSLEARTGREDSAAYASPSLSDRGGDSDEVEDDGA